MTSSSFRSPHIFLLYKHFNAIGQTISSGCFFGVTFLPSDRPLTRFLAQWPDTHIGLCAAQSSRRFCARSPPWPSQWPPYSSHLQSDERVLISSKLLPMKPANMEKMQRNKKTHCPGLLYFELIVYGIITWLPDLGHRQLFWFDKHFMAFLVVGISISPSSRNISESIDDQSEITTCLSRRTVFKLYVCINVLNQECLWSQKPEFSEYSPLFVLNMMVVMSAFSKSASESSTPAWARKREAQWLNFIRPRHIISYLIVTDR